MNQGSLEDRVANASTLLDVLLILRDMIAIDTHVATLAYAESIAKPYDPSNGYGILRCKPFPLAREQSGYSIEAYWLEEGAAFKRGQKVLVVFCDRDFISSMQAIGGEAKETLDKGLHSMKHGIIISSPQLELTEEEKEELLDF